MKFPLCLRNIFGGSVCIYLVTIPIFFYQYTSFLKAPNIALAELLLATTWFGVIFGGTTTIAFIVQWVTKKPHPVTWLDMLLATIGLVWATGLSGKILWETAYHQSAGRWLYIVLFAITLGGFYLSKKFMESTVHRPLFVNWL